ncbi:hypothetical protein [Halorussus marinus]|uniref:hypothetical protein n=1 Tax=Halorussus marinus TaxID=2505976 RepID=UPI0010929B05|nr:hypothetical protein [Halorussus marinus]
MSAYRAVLLALVVGSSLAIAAPATAAPDLSPDSPDPVGSATADPPVAQSDDGNESESENQSASPSLGADISSFMQSSAAEMSGAVETGMWSASFNATDNETKRKRLVERRTGDLRAELADLRDRKAELESEREAGNLSGAAYKAQVGQLVGRINALQSTIDATAPRARQANADVDAIAGLETDARNLTGPAVAAVARNTSGVGVPGPPDDVGGGPPEDAGIDDSGNANESAASARSGTDGASNGEGDPGPPEDGGPEAGPSEEKAVADPSDNRTDAAGPDNGADGEASGEEGADGKAAGGNGEKGADGKAAGGNGEKGADGKATTTDSPDETSQRARTSIPDGADDSTTETGSPPKTTAVE